MFHRPTTTGKPPVDESLHLATREGFDVVTPGGDDDRKQYSGDWQGAERGYAFQAEGPRCTCVACRLIFTLFTEEG
jgi:hypothetical protein